MAPSPTRAQQSLGERRDSVPALWGGLQPGPHPVGYRRLATPDGIVHVWYPAATAGTRLRFAEYVGNGAVSLRSLLSGTGVGAATIDSLLDATLLAARDQEPIDGALPLVLVAHGNGQDVSDQVVLCEFLGSHGFVVAATPSPTLRTPLEREAQVGALAERQARELATAVGALGAIVGIDSQRVAVVGHSFGARAALLLAMRTGSPHVKVIVSLDGGIGTATAIEEFRDAPSFSADRPLPPLLHFSETLDPFMTPDFTLLKSLPFAALDLEPTRAMRHLHFTIWGFAAGRFAELMRATRGTDQTADAVREVHLKTLTFIRRYLGPGRP